MSTPENVLAGYDDTSKQSQLVIQTREDPRQPIQENWYQQRKHLWYRVYTHDGSQQY